MKTKEENKNCIFCRIVREEIPAVKVWEDSEFISFKDIKPVIEGHTIIAPKKHFRTLLDLDKNASEKYVNAIRETGKVLMKKYNADGFNSMLNNGEAAGQVVNHVHFHIVPRKKGDNKRGLFIG